MKALLSTATASDGSPCLPAGHGNATGTARAVVLVRMQTQGSKDDQCSLRLPMSVGRARVSFEQSTNALVSSSGRAAQPAAGRRQRKWTCCRGFVTLNTWGAGKRKVLRFSPG